MANGDNRPTGFTGNRTAVSPVDDTATQTEENRPTQVDDTATSGDGSAEFQTQENRPTQVPDTGVGTSPTTTDTQTQQNRPSQVDTGGTDGSGDGGAEFQTQENRPTQVPDTGVGTSPTAADDFQTQDNRPSRIAPTPGPQVTDTGVEDRYFVGRGGGQTVDRAQAFETQLTSRPGIDSDDVRIDIVERPGGGRFFRPAFSRDFRRREAAQMATAAFAASPFGPTGTVFPGDVQTRQNRPTGVPLDNRVTPGEINPTAEGPEVSAREQVEQAAGRIGRQTGVQIGAGDVERSGDQFTLSESGVEAIASSRTRAQAGAAAFPGEPAGAREDFGIGTDQRLEGIEAASVGVGRGTSTFGIGTDERVQDIQAAQVMPEDIGEIQERGLDPDDFVLQRGEVVGERQTLGEMFGGVGKGAAREVTPHSRMTLGTGEGLQARAAQEEVFAQRAESGFETLMGLGIPSKAEAGAMLFQTGEIAERQIGGLTEGVASASPTEGMGPSVLGEPVGDVPGNIVRIVGGGVGAGVGSITQAPVTTTAGFTGDTLTETQELEQPPRQLSGIGEVEQDTSPSEVSERIAAANPGVGTEDIDVTRTEDGFDVDTDLSNQDIRERVAAFNPGTDTSDIWFTEGGDPMATFISSDGQNPTEASGGTVATGVRTAEAQAELFGEMPLSSTIAIGVPVARSTGRGFQRGLAETGSRTVPTPSIERFNVGDVSGVGLGIRSSRGKVETTQPVASIARGTEGRTPFELGTPEGRPSRTLTESVTPEMTGAETRIFTRALERSGAESEATRVRAFRETQARTQRSGLQPRELETTIGDVLENQGIPREAAGEVVGLARAEEAQIYGSVVQRASARQVGEPGVSRTPRDIDIGEVASSEAFGRQATQRINEAVGREVVRLEDGTPTAVETGQKLFDIHEAGVESAAVESPMAGADVFFGVRGERPVRTTEGIETTTLSEQTARKGRGAMEQFTPEPRQVGEVESVLTPSHGGRVKDIPDFFMGEMANIRGLELAGRERSMTRAMGEIRAVEAQGALETWLGTFGEGIQQRTRSEFVQALEGERAAPQTRIADFSQPTTQAGARSPAMTSPSVVVDPSPGPIGGFESPSSPPPDAATSPSPVSGVGAASAFSPASPFAVTGGSAATSVFGGIESSPSPTQSAPSSEPASAAPSPESPTSPSQPAESPSPITPALSPSLFDPTLPSPSPVPSPSPDPSPIPSPDPPTSPSPPTGPSSPDPETPRLLPEPGGDDDDEQPFSAMLPTGQEFFNPLASGSEFLFGGMFEGDGNNSNNPFIG